MNWYDFSGTNQGYVLELYDRYLRDPNSVDAAARAFFATWTPPGEQNGHAAPVQAAPQVDINRVVGAVNYAQAIREYGHAAAQLDPLGSAPPGDPALDPAAHGIDESDLAALPASLIGGVLASQYSSALEATRALREIYISTTGYDFDHIRDPKEREWLRDAVESRRFCPQNQPVDEVGLLKRLTEVEGFERFLNRVFPGKHRFSIEGLDTLVPLLDEVIDASARAGENNILIGMAHRGRLNVLAHVLGKSYKQILAEFKDPVNHNRVNDDLGWTGDVKYHLGAQRAVRNGAPVDAVVTLAPNPSHLEAVNPVVEGMARAAGTAVDQPGAPKFDPKTTQPILIHGDAAFPGQGIVAETLNLSRLPGYWTGGTVHIITNNQLGFTTDPTDSRSTLYASDLAKGFKIPVVHVNADDPIAVIQAARLAVAYLEEFERDFVIDLIGYRRYGHNEGDEPAFTQPLLYKIIDQHPTVRQLWGEALVQRGIIPAGEPERLAAAHDERLQALYTSLDPEKDLIDYRPQPPEPGTARRVKTSVSRDWLAEIYADILKLPEGFALHPRLARVLGKRGDGLNDPNAKAIDWATAETLALASILAEGTAIRLTGQDVERGTYSQRHAVLHHAETGETYTPLQTFPHARAAFEIHNSPLSEAAALGFEYGYNVHSPRRLVIWEAQYGDFINGAQTILDEFIVSARAKFGLTPSLVILLPHAYEGAGPDHSSGRLERFLESAADTNLRVANATTAAQYFHLLRRQALLLESDPLPLVVMTPKSLLRHPLVSSSLNELADGHWQPVLDDADANPEGVRRIILCSGKIYVDLVSSKLRAADTALVRVEQLYLFPAEDVAAAVARYPNAAEIVWVQEEPENMGAWPFVRPLLAEFALPVRYVGRPRSSSPAEGSLAWHNINQAAIIEQAFASVEEVAR